jgi:hypothetical protein
MGNRPWKFRFVILAAAAGLIHHPVSVFSGYPYSCQGGAPISVSTPNSMYPSDDETIPCSSCNNTPLRLITYQVLKADGSTAPNIQLQEALTRNPTWTCTNKGDPGIITAVCTINHTLSDGTFTDGWSLSNDGFTPTGCGYGVAPDYWQWCSTPSPTTLGALGGYVHTDAVCVNGVKSTLSNPQKLTLGANNPIPKSNPPACQ